MGAMTKTGFRRSCAAVRGQASPAFFFVSGFVLQYIIGLGMIAG
jgi:hypothetical protein